MQLLLGELLQLHSYGTVLYVEPPVDLIYEARKGRLNRTAVAGRVRQERVGEKAVTVLRPRKVLPRVVGPLADRSLERQVLRAVRKLEMQSPLLWINDANYAAFTKRLRWPLVYDVTDDWLVASLTERERRRLATRDAQLVAHAEAVVVCSPDLARSRGAWRAVEVIPNGVEVGKFQMPQARPSDLPEGPVALYVGTLHEDRLDIELCEKLALQRPDIALVLLGPNSLTSQAETRLRAFENIHLLGARPYDDVPGYLQHADVVVVPHRLSPFTESLDPIKAYECLAVGRPTVATPVAGFRFLGDPVRPVDPAHFVPTVEAVVDAGWATSTKVEVPTWRDRAVCFASVLDRVKSSAGEE